MPLCTFSRASDTNQRIAFDVDPLGRYLITGSVDCRAIVYDLNTCTEAASITGLPGAWGAVMNSVFACCIRGCQRYVAKFGLLNVWSIVCPLLIALQRASAENCEQNNLLSHVRRVPKFWTHLEKYCVFVTIVGAKRPGAAARVERR